MSILKGEHAKVVTIFGTVTVPSGAQSRSAYLARPDLGGEWPTILVMTGEHGITSPVKEICRRLARQGFAVIAPESVFSFPDLERYEAYIANPAADWSNAEYGYGLLSLPAAREDAVIVAGTGRQVEALAVVDLPADLDALGRVAVPTVALLSGDAVDSATVDQARQAAPRTGWVVYRGVTDDWWDDGGEGWDDEVATDALTRMSEFFAQHLPPAH